MVCALVCFAAIAVAAAPVGAWLRKSAGREANLSVAAALIFVALAAKLVVG